MRRLFRGGRPCEGHLGSRYAGLAWKANITRMAAEISPVTQENEEITLSDRELLETTYRTVARMEREMSVLLAAWAMGGLRGLRNAARTREG